MRFRNIGTGFTLVALIAATSTTHGESLKGTRWRVNCNGGGPSLKKTLTHVAPGDTVFVNGTCRERVSITVGPLTIDGGGNAILDGAGVPPDDAEFNGVLTVDGAQGVTIRRMTIRNGAGQGILGLHGANMIVEKTVVEGFDPGPAIGLSNSAAELTDVTLRNNGLGIDAYSNSTVILQGDIDISQNLRGGLSLNMNTTAEIRGANVHVDNNGGVGILVVGDSRLAFSGFDVSRGSSLSTSFNKGPGMLLDHGLLATPGSSLPPGDWVITSSGNGGPGFLLAANGSMESPFGTARFVVEANPVGIQLGQGSTAVIVGGLNVKNNTQAGVVAEDASLTLVSIPPNPSAIQGNGTADLALSFGSRSTIDGVQVGAIQCDATVLSRGTSVCP